MGLSYGLIRLGNRLFPPVVHPFNLQNDGRKSYARWQFEKGADTVKFFTENYPPETMFRGKRVLDMGCGAAGKSLYYVNLGAAHVTGVDVVAHYEAEALALAEELGLSERFSFCLAPAEALPFPDGSFDSIIMNDFMEHCADPAAVLREALRLLAPGGRCYVNFPPYGHPYGAHMSDLISIPWVHGFFSEDALCRAYERLAGNVPDGERRVALRIATEETGKKRIAYINKMTLKRFHKLLRSLELRPEYYAEVPLRPFLKPLARCPLTKEAFVRMAVCVLNKPGSSEK